MHKVDILIVGYTGLVGESIYKHLINENQPLSFLLAQRNPCDFLILRIIRVYTPNFLLILHVHGSSYS